MSATGGGPRSHPNAVHGVVTQDASRPIAPPADHGNDPTWSGSDHTREYIPVIVYGKSIKPGINFGVRNSFADIAGTIADILGIEFETVGLSFKDIIYLT